MAYPDFTTGLDLLKYTLDQGGQTPSTSDDYATLVKANLLVAYWSILGYRPWPWAKAPTPKVVTTEAKVTATVSSISGTTVTLSGNLTPSQAGKKWYLDSQGIVYRVSAHTDNTDTLTLDATYVETVTAGLSTFYQDEYTLATDVIVPHGPLWLRGQYEGPIDLLEREEFVGRYGRMMSRGSGGLVEAATLLRWYQSGATQAPVIQIAPWPEDAVNLEYEYAERHVLTFDGVAATDTPKVPLEYRWVIGEWALWLLFRKKSDDGIIPTDPNIQSGLMQMQSLYFSFANRPRFHTRPRFGLGVRN